MTKVYLVSKVDYYSDYRIVAVCSTEERAIAALQSCGEDRAEITEWEIDKKSPKPSDRKPWLVKMDHDGNTQSVERKPSDGFIAGEDRYRQPFRRYRVWARDEQHAVKIAYDKRTKDVASYEELERQMLQNLPVEAQTG